MCHLCDYPRLLKESGLGSTPNRLKIFEIIGNNKSPLSAQEIFETVSRRGDINRVTVYRILDLLVEYDLIDRISGAGRSFRYGLAPNANHQAHPHFYCRRCGNLECLNPESLRIDMEPLQRSFPGHVENVEVRLDGTCKNCLKKGKKPVHSLLSDSR
jgi:Fur family ferric uptake transcriptional regulator